MYVARISPQGVLGLLIGVAIWAILFVVILEVLKKASPFSGWTCYVLAACVSLLSVTGMHRMLAGHPAGGESHGREDPFGFLLLPYAAMGIATLIVLLLLFLQKLARRRTSRLRTSETRLHGTPKEDRVEALPPGSENMRAEGEPKRSRRDDGQDL